MCPCRRSADVPDQTHHCESDRNGTAELLILYFVSFSSSPRDLVEMRTLLCWLGTPVNELIVST